MSQPLKIAVLCNNEMALPTITQLAYARLLGCIAVPAANRELLQGLQTMMQGSGVDVLPVEKKHLSVLMKSLVEQKGISVFFMLTFPFILSEACLRLAPYGVLNFHFGKLPNYRGVNPILAHMLHQEPTAAITIHQVDKGIDTGAIIMEQHIPIETNDTFGLVQSKLGGLAAMMAGQLVKMLSLGGPLPSRPQSEEQAKYFGQPTAADITLKWETMSSKQIQRMVNACNPWNKAAAASIKGRMIGITEVVPIGPYQGQPLRPGTIVHMDNVNGLQVYCADGQLLLLSVAYLPEGFFSGWKLAMMGISAGQCFD